MGFLDALSGIGSSLKDAGSGFLNGLVGNQGLVHGIGAAPTTDLGGDPNALPLQMNSMASQAPPQLSGQMTTGVPTMGTPYSLGERANTPDARGLTFGDKVSAAADIWNGRNQEADANLQQAKAAQEARDKETTARSMQTRASQILADSIENGTINPSKLANGYANAGLGLDVNDYIAAAKAASPSIQAVQGEHGFVGGFNPHSGSLTTLRDSDPYVPQYIKGPTGQPMQNPQWLADQRAQELQKRQVLVQNPLPTRARTGGSDNIGGWK